MHLNLNLQERYTSRSHQSEIADETMDIESQKFKYHKLNTDSSSLVAGINPNYSVSQDHLLSYSNAAAVSND